MMDGNWGYGGPGWFGMGFGMLLFWGLLIVGVIVLVRWLAAGRRDPAPPPHASALDILAQRYARGEIDRAEYEQKRRDLGGG
jgi:putative membrane protein